ncbi:unnamed protein product [Closterium sp. NIES-53]
MASLYVLTFDHEGRPIKFDTWLDDLQLYLLSDSRDSISLFDHTSGASLAPPATADSATHSQWLTHDAAARLARGASGGSVRCPYVIRTGDGAGQTCGNFHTQHRCFSRLDDAWHAQFGDEAERPCWLELLRFGVDIFALDYDAILGAMYALSVSAEGDCYLCVLPDSGVEAAALGASESSLPGTAPTEALHSFTLDSDASRCFFRDSTTLTPLPAPVPTRLADPSGGLVLARSSTVLLCPAVPSGSLSGLRLPLFSTNLVSTAALQDVMVTTTTHGGQRVSICTCTRTGRHLATFTHRPGSILYTLNTEPTQVSASPLALACPALPSLRPRVAARRSSPLVSPDDCSPADSPQKRVNPTHVSGQDRERYFLLVVDDYTRYTTVFPLRSKGEVPDALIPWIRTVHLQLCERFRADLPILRLHSDGGAPHWLSHGGGRLRSSTLRISSTLWPCIFLPETSPTLRWTGKVGDALVFRVRGSCAFARDTSADKLSSRAIPCVFLGFRPDAPGWQFYHLTSRHVLPSQDVTFDESVPFYCLLPYCTAPLPPPPPLFLAPGPPPVDPLPPQGPAPSGVSQVDPLALAEPVMVTIDSGAARGAASRGAEPTSAEPRCAEPASAEPGGAEPEGAEAGGAESEGAESGGAEPEGAEPGGAEPGGAESEGGESGGAEPEGAELWGAEPKGAEPGGAESEGAESGGDEPRGTASAGGPAGASPRLSHRREPLSPQQLRKWFSQRTHLRSGAARVGDPAAGGTGAGGAGAGDPRAGGPAAGGIGAGGAGATSLRGAGVITRAGGPGGLATVHSSAYWSLALVRVV